MKVIESFYLENNKLKPLEHKGFIEGSFEHPLINVYDIEKSEILGFGGAFNETSAYNYSLLSENEKKKALEYLFGETGLRYNLFRLCIGSCDFALDEYCYVEDNDFDLKTFSIERDKKYIIPFILDAIKYSKQNLRFLASPWSPPKWMKTNGERIHGGKLKVEYYELYAEYLAKFIESYKKEGINIEFLTIQNEQKASQTWESCTFNIDEEVNFVKILKKVLKNHQINVKILGWDHNKERLVERSKVLEEKDLFDGMAFHWYSGDHFDAVNLTRLAYPDKILLETEFCKSYLIDETSTRYSEEYINILNSGSNGFIEWLLIVDENGGAFHYRKPGSGCAAPILVDSKSGKVNLNHDYFQRYMFSHFIKPGSVSLWTSSFDKNIEVSATKNKEDNTIVVNIINNLKDMDLKLYFHGKFLEFNSKKDTISVLKIEL